MRIARNVIEKIIAHTERDAPVEACGFLIGAKGEITRHYPMTNAEGRTDHYTFDPNEQLAVYRAAGREKFEIIGVYHSHPATPAEPSPEDIKLARKANFFHIIISLMDGGKTLRGFRIRDGKAEEEPLNVYED